jgi:4-azaleucine resistance transporter AzlC
MPFRIEYVRSIWRTLDHRTLRDIALACVAVWFVAVSYGAVAVASGLPRWLPVMLSVLVLAGSSEIAFTGLVAAGGNPLAAALAGLLLNARHVPYGLALPDVAGGRRRWLGFHVMNDESVAFCLAEREPPRRRAAYWTCGIGVLLGWPAGAFLGTVLGSFVRNPDALGLDAMFPAVICALVLPALRDRLTRRAAVTGAAIAVGSAWFLPAGLPILLALVGLGAVWRQPDGAGPAGRAVSEPAARGDWRSA